MTGNKVCGDIRKKWRKIDMQLSCNTLHRRRHSTERWIVLIQELVIKTSAQEFPGTLLDFTDVDEHSSARIHRPGKSKIRHVIATGAVSRFGLRAEHGEIFAVTPTWYAQTPRGRELETFADRQQHDAS